MQQRCNIGIKRMPHDNVVNSINKIKFIGTFECIVGSGVYYVTSTIPWREVDDIKLCTSEKDW